MVRRRRFGCEGGGAPSAMRAACVGCNTTDSSAPTERAMAACGAARASRAARARVRDGRAPSG
eukprot:1653521-Prymnesium_polylepis.1